MHFNTCIIHTYVYVLAYGLIGVLNRRHEQFRHAEIPRGVWIRYRRRRCCSRGPRSTCNIYRFFLHVAYFSLSPSLFLFLSFFVEIYNCLLNFASSDFLKEHIWLEFCYVCVFQQAHGTITSDQSFVWKKIINVFLSLRRDVIENEVILKIRIQLCTQLGFDSLFIFFFFFFMRKLICIVLQWDMSKIQTTYNYVFATL